MLLLIEKLQQQHLNEVSANLSCRRNIFRPPWRESSVKLTSKLLLDPNKVCGTCMHVRLNLGLVGSLDFKLKLQRIMQGLTTQCKTTEDISIDDNLFEVLALLNLLQKQKFYCRKEKGWVNLFDAACYAWQPRKRHPPSEAVF